MNGGQWRNQPPPKAKGAPETRAKTASGRYQNPQNKAQKAAQRVDGGVQLNKVDLQGWLTWVLGQIADHKITRLDELMLWCYAAYAAQLIPLRGVRPPSTDGYIQQDFLNERGPIWAQAIHQEQ